MNILQKIAFFALAASLLWLAGCEAVSSGEARKKEEKVDPLQVVVGEKVRLLENKVVQAKNRKAQKFWKRLYANTENQEEQFKAIIEHLEEQSSPESVRQLLAKYPRVVEGKYLARLDGQRQVIADMESTEWIGAPYYAVREEARDINVPGFDSFAYALDPTDGTVKILSTAYEKEPYTGRVLIGKDNPNQFGVAVIDRGVLVQGEVEEIKEQLAEHFFHSYERGEHHETARFYYDAIGQGLLGWRSDRNGTELARLDYRPAEMKKFVGTYSARLGTFNKPFKMVLTDNGRVALFENGVLPIPPIPMEPIPTEPAGQGFWIFIDEEVQLLFPVKGYPISVLHRKPDGALAVVATIDDATGKRIRFAQADQKTFPVYINPLPPRGMLASRVRVEGEFIYDKENPDEFPFPFDGVVVDYYDREHYLMKREEPVKTGRYHGIVTWWYRHLNAAGQQQLQFEAEYVNGDPEGRTVWYRENGSLEYEGFWTAGQLTRATTWDAADQQQGQVVNGDGTLRFYHPNGQKRMEETYANGKLTKSQFWDEEGNPVDSVGPQFIPARPRIIIN